MRSKKGKRKKNHWKDEVKASSPTVEQKKEKRKKKKKTKATKREPG